ncbi:MAG: hypothetical protein ABIM89_03370, partial [Mycobacteriales bacterium]
VLAAMAGERASAEQSAVLERCIGDPDLDEAGVERVRHIIGSTGVLADVERMVAERADAAVAALGAAQLDPTAVQALTGLARAAATRRG